MSSTRGIQTTIRVYHMKEGIHRKTSLPAKKRINATVSLHFLPVGEPVSSSPTENL